MFGREPVLWMNAIRLVILCLGTFGLKISDIQLVGLMAALEAVMTLVTRSQVTPVTKIQDNLTPKQAEKLDVYPPKEDNK